MMVREVIVVHHNVGFRQADLCSVWSKEVNTIYKTHSKKVHTKFHWEEEHRLILAVNSYTYPANTPLLACPFLWAQACS